MLGALVDLVMPAECAGCGADGQRLSYEVCARCVAALEGMRAGPTRPVPPPDGLPPCFALGEYGGELRELVIGYKDRGRHRLARPLGALLAEVIAVGLPGDGPVLVLYVPDTGAAARQRYGDHMRRLAHGAAARLRGAGRPAVARSILRARPRADSAGLDALQRAEAAQAAFALRRIGAVRAARAAARASVVLVDDVITTGFTLAAATDVLARQGIQVDICALLAATRRRMPA